MLVVDGLGGAPHPETGRSELETASLPNLDSLARRSAAGLTTPVAPGVTPGSGPGHLALFGYDPVKYLTGRGVLEALGIGVELGEDDVAARGNLCTVDADGLLVDRRAGRIPTVESAALVRKLDAIRVSFAEVAAYPVRDHRFVLTLSGPGLGADVSETDPQVEGVAPLEPMPTTFAANRQRPLVPSTSSSRRLGRRCRAGTEPTWSRSGVFRSCRASRTWGGCTG